MADDDDIDKFLEDIENDESLNLTVVENPGATATPTGGEDDRDDTLEEADEFLRELENTEVLRKEMFSSPGMSSTPKFIEKIKSRLVNDFFINIKKRIHLDLIMWQFIFLLEYETKKVFLSLQVGPNIRECLKSQRQN